MCAWTNEAECKEKMPQAASNRYPSGISHGSSDLNKTQKSTQRIKYTDKMMTRQDPPRLHKSSFPHVFLLIVVKVDNMFHARKP